MTVKIRQVWGNLEATVINDYYELLAGHYFGVNVRENGAGFATLWSIFGHVPFGERSTVTLMPGVQLVRSPKVGSTVDVTLFEDAGHEKLVTAPVGVPSNAIIWQAFAAPAEAIGAGIGAVVGGVAGYVLKPVDPVISALIGAGLGGGAGYGLAYLATTGIPEIPIPTFGAIREGAGTPARLGKYQITG